MSPDNPSEFLTTTASNQACKIGTPSVAGTRDSAKPAQRRLKITFWLDITLLVSVCALQDVSFTGLLLHEWLGIAIVAIIFAHLLLAWSWIATQSRRFFASQSVRERINHLLNLSLFAAATAVIFSGVLISQKAIPTLTRTKAARNMDWRWDTLHNRFSQDVLMLSGLHLAINWDWTIAAVQKVVFPWVDKMQARFRRFREGVL
jgi:hypothetical protein